jgi:hypothetical protein
VQKQSFGAQVYSARAPGASRGAQRGLQPSLGSTDDAAVHPAVAALPFAQKGLVLGAILARMPPEAFGARFPDAAGRQGQAALEALGAGPRAARASTLASLLSLVRAPVPAGIERVHPAWLRERLVPESSAVIRGVQGAAGDRDGLPAEVRRVAQQILTERGEASSQGVAISAAGAAELRRRVFAGLVPLAELGAPTGAEAAPLMTLSFAALEEAIEARGAETLGVSLRGAPPAVVARAAANLGGRLARILLDAAAQAGPADTREAARQLVARVATEKPVDLAAHLGARALAVALATEGDDLSAVAQRLPPALGRRLIAFGAELRE